MRADGELLVVGGGLAGLAAALRAARAGRAVTVCESGAFGRDKVCGEFVSPEAAADMDALGCGDWIDALAPAPMQRVLLFSPSGARLELRLPGPPAWSVTRRALEGYLAERARQAGATLLERAPVKDLSPDRGGWRWHAGDAEGRADGVVAAFGKRSTLDAAMDLPRARAPAPYGAIKTYFAAGTGALEADVELHLIRGGYVGLNAVEDGRVGLCALLDGAPTTHWAQIGARFADSVSLRSRLERLGEPVAQLKGLARFGFGLQRLVHHEGGATALLAGDAARMMPSFTGDGMAVALRSGRLAAEALHAAEPHRAYELAYRREFDRRLRLANLLHTVFFRPSVFGALAPLLAKTPRAVERLYEWTRGAAAAGESRATAGELPL